MNPIENVVIEGPHLETEDPRLLWGDEPYVTTSARDLPELLVKCGIYKTTSDARRAGRSGPIPPGFTILKASKKVPQFCIWNPAALCPSQDEADEL